MSSDPSTNWRKAQRKMELAKAKKQQKRNRDTKPPRRRTWTEAEDDGLVHERIMPRDERDRRKAVEEAAQRRREAQQEILEMPSDSVVGTVVEVSTAMCRVDINGEILMCGLRGTLGTLETGFSNVVAVGDNVIIEEIQGVQGVVERVLPRHNMLVRPSTDTTHLHQIIATNIDQLLIVAAWREPVLWLELIDRYLITAERNDITPIICINKIDLTEDVEEVQATLKPYFDLDYQVVFTSVVTGTGLDQLRSLLSGQRTVIAGMSGVGKSSLLNLLQPKLNLKTHEVSNDSGEGQHTTTQARMWSLEFGGYVIDTPGVREFGLAGLKRNELIHYYPDIEIFAVECRFRDCSHVHEPNCAVRTAVEQGQIREWRFHNYQKLGGLLD